MVRAQYTSQANAAIADCLSRTHEAHFHRMVNERMRFVTATNADSARIRHARGDRFAYVNAHAHNGNLSMRACACDIRGQYPMLPRILPALQRFYRRVLTSRPVQPPTGPLPRRFDFNLILHDFDTDWQRCCQIPDPRARQMPPPLAPAAYSDEHAIAIPTFNFDVTGWSFSSASKAGVLPPWRERRAKLVWRGSNQRLNTHPSRTALLTAGTRHPDLIDAKEPQLSPRGHGGMRHYLNWTEQARYKYVAYTPGLLGAYSWRLASLLRSGSALVMERGPLHHSWFSRYLKPLVHFLPVDAEFRDVTRIVAWAKANDALVQRIAARTAHFARTNINDACAADAILLTLALLASHNRSISSANRPWDCPADCVSTIILP